MSNNVGVWDLGGQIGAQETNVGAWDPLSLAWEQTASIRAGIKAVA